MTPSPRPGPALRRAAGAAAVLLLLATLLAAFPWDWLREPLARFLSERSGRPVAITERLEVRLGAPLRVRLDGLVVGNPAWAREREFLRAERVELHLRVLPLLRGQVELAQVRLRAPQLGLERLPDGRRTWSSGRDGAPGGMPVRVEALDVDRGVLRFIAPQWGADLQARWSTDEGAGAAASALPLRFEAQGQWRGQSLQLAGRTGGLLSLQPGAAGPRPFALQVEARAGATTLQAEGQVLALAGLAGGDLQVRLQGRSLADLARLSGLVLPASPPYAIAGRLQHDGPRWQARGLQGRLGRTDLAGDLVLDRSRPVPLLRGTLRSERLEVADLAPLVGARRAPRPAPTARADGRVLPRVPLDVLRWRAMDADVQFQARRLVGAPHLPLDGLSAQVQLQAGDLRLEPLALDLAGGRLAGRLRLDGREALPRLQVDLRADGLQLPRLLPAEPLTRASAGTLRGHVVLEGQGVHLAEMLGRSSGELSLLMGPGRISNLLLELAGLDGAEILKFLASRDRQVRLRCAAAGFAVRQGLMQARTLVLDTADTVIWGEGRIDLAAETLALTFRPQPKDRSLLVLRSPLRLTGTLGAPQAGVDMGAVAARAGAALALGAINPLLGLAATVETGPGQDVDCAAVLQQAAAPAAAASGARPPASGRRP